MKSCNIPLLVLILGLSGVLALDKRSHSHAASWIDHCWDHGSGHIMDPFCPHGPVCGPAPTIDNGVGSEPNPTTTAIGSVVTYTCNAGYLMIGGAGIICEENAEETGPKGKWSTPPTCNKECPDAPAVINGYIVGPNDTDIGSVVQYQCNDGYAFQDNTTTVECLPNSSWTKTPQCKRTECLPIPEVANAVIVSQPNETSVGTFVQYSCNKGYNLVKNDTIYCMSAGPENAFPVWSVPLPECQKIPLCPTVPQVDNAVIVSEPTADNVVGTIVQYNCSEGYVLLDKDTIECMPPGENNSYPAAWSSPLPVCIQVCLPIPQVDNAELVNPPTETVVGVAVQYRCNEGYELLGNDTIVCMSLGQENTFASWSEQLPVCLPVVCPAIPKVDNAVLVSEPTNTEVGTVLQYNCSEGYFLLDNDTIECMPGGENNSYSAAWSSPLPVCQQGCDPVPTIEHASVIGPMETIEGSSVMYICDDPYVMVGSDMIDCINGSWTKLPKCIIGSDTSDGKNRTTVAHAYLCPPPLPTINFGYMIGPNETYIGTQVKYNCTEPFFFVDNDTITCQPDGTWSTYPNCTGECPLPASIAKGSYIIGLTPEKTMFAKYSCARQYGLSGSERLNCDNGIWVPEPPTCECEPKPLDIVFIIDGSGSVGENGFVQTKQFLEDMVDKYPVDSTRFALVEFSSHVELQFHLNEFINDTESLKDRIRNTTYMTGNTETADALSFVRNNMLSEENGARANETQIVIIVTDGRSMYPNRTVIESQALRDAGVIIYSVGVADADNDELKEMATYTQFVFHVQDYGSINTVAGPLAEYTRCVYCQALPKIANGQSTGLNETFEGSTGQYSCAKGYSLVGPSEVICQRNGSWSEIPTCECNTRPPLDVVFVIDGSSSVGDDGFSQTRKFLANMVDQYPADTTHFGLLQFSNNANVEFYLDAFVNNTDDLKEKIMNTTYMEGSTSTNTALSFARTNMFSESNGMRPNVTHVAIVVTDGQSSDTNSTLSEAQLLRDEGVTIYSVGVGIADQGELKGMASRDEYVFNVQNFGEFGSVAGPLADASSCFVSS